MRKCVLEDTPLEDELLQKLRAHDNLQAEDKTFRELPLDSIESVTVRFQPGQHIRNKNVNQEIIYTRKPGDTLWSKVCTPTNDAFPSTLAIFVVSLMCL